MAAIKVTAVGKILYRLDFFRLIPLILPPQLRTASDWLRIVELIANELNKLYEALYIPGERVESFFNVKLFEARLTPQVIILETALNDLFDYELRRITVRDFSTIYDYLYSRVQDIDPPLQYIYSRAIGSFDALAPDQFVYNIGERDIGLVTDYVVNVPFSDSATINQIKSFVGKINPAGRTFDVITIT